MQGLIQKECLLFYNAGHSVTGGHSRGWTFLPALSSFCSQATDGSRGPGWQHSTWRGGAHGAQGCHWTPPHWTEHLWRPTRGCERSEASAVATAMQKTNHPNSQIVFFFLNKHSMQALVQHWKKSIANGGNRVEKQSFVAENSLYVSVVISMEINRRHSFQSNLWTSMCHHPNNAVILIIGAEKNRFSDSPNIFCGDGTTKPTLQSAAVIPPEWTDSSRKVMATSDTQTVPAFQSTQPWHKP